MDGTESERRWGGVQKQDVFVRNPVQFPPSLVKQKMTSAKLMPFLFNINYFCFAKSVDIL